MRILLQFPEGLKKIAIQEADELRKKGHEVFLSGSPCYGACDLALEEAKTLEVEKIIHYGHSQFVKNEPIEVEYKEFPVDFELENLEASAELFKGKIIGLATTVQYVHKIDEIRKFLEKNGVRVKYGKGNYCKYAGQVLGCDWGAIKSIENEVDAVLFVGDGVFHPYGLNTEKPFYSINPKNGQLKQHNEEIEKIRKRRKGNLIALIEAKRIGIIVSTKIGQRRVGLAEEIKRKLKEVGVESEILVLNEVNQQALENFMSFDGYIITACPRLADDEWEKPTISLEQFERFVGLKKELL